MRYSQQAGGRVALMLIFLFQPVRPCTIGAFSARSTVEQRPILWKNRDVTNPDQEVRFLRGPRFRFLANVYAGETLAVWAGINEAGFAIMNSNSYNLSGSDPLDDDGVVMRLALGNCAAVDEFARLLDSLNKVGRSTPANFGVFDAFGNTAIFEAGNTSYTRFDAGADTGGFLIRANFSLSGGPARLVGKNRYERALQLCRAASAGHRLNTEFLIRTLARDLGQVDFHPYPLPFYGRFGNLPPGYLPTDSTICRFTTRSVEVLVGPADGAHTGMMWVLLGAPFAALPVPLWVVAETVPEPLDGRRTAPLCDEAQKLGAYLYPLPEFPRAVNTFRLARWLEHSAPVESAIFHLVAEKQAEWGENGPDRAAARALTDSVCSLILETYREFWARVNSEAVVRAQRPAVARATLCRTFNSPALYDITGRVAARPGSGVYFLLTPETRERLVLIGD